MNTHRKFNHLGQRLLFFLVTIALTTGSIAQTQITDYVIFGGKKEPGQTNPAAPGYGVQLGSSTKILGGLIGSYYLVKTTGNSTLSNVFSGGIIQLTNSNIVNGKLAARNDSSLGGTIISVGSSAVIKGNIDANGNIVVTGGTVSGSVTHPPGTTYNGPVPAGGETIGIPNLPVLPAMPAITIFPAAGATNITNTQSINPGAYGNMTLGGNKTITFKGPGIYVFNSIKNTGTSNDFVFDFLNSISGDIRIYVHGDVDLGKVKASLKNGGNATRIYLETHGTGATSATGKVAFTIANGSSGNSSKWLGAVWAPYAAISAGAGTGSTDVTGALWSGTQVTIQSGVTINLFCDPPNVTIGNGVDNIPKDTIPLDFRTTTRLVVTSTTPGVSFSWTAFNGGIIDPTYTSPNNDTIKVLVAGSYVVSASVGGSCITKDTVVVTGRLKNIIGSELRSIYDNNTTDNTFFLIQNDSVLIDVIAKAGFRDSVARLLINNTTLYGLRDTIPNGTSNFIITGMYPVVHIPNLNALFEIINYCRPHYQGYTNSGLVNTEGDAILRTHLVRQGYGVTGDGIKIGVLSDSYATIREATTATLPLQPITVPQNPIPQTFTTNTVAQDVANGDLPGDTTFTWSTPSHVVNPNGFTKNVHVLQDYPFRRSDEGRAMLQIIHDVAPGAELYFRTAFFTANDFAVGIRQLKDAGCNIIVEDMTYGTEPFFKDGVVAKAVDEVVAQGVSYFSAAGNFDRKSYGKAFSGGTVASGPFAGKKAHNFGSGDMFQQLKLAPGNYTFVLQWMDNNYTEGELSGTIYDLDFYLTPNTDGTSLFGFNRDNTGGDPIEFIPFTVPGRDTVGADSMVMNMFIVNNTTTGDPVSIKYIAFRGGVKIMEFDEGNSTITGQANSVGAMTIGAARFDKAPPIISPPLIETFSSSGGTLTNGVIRNKPDFVAPDGVNTTVRLGQDYPNSALDGYSNFFGTSAASPHAAAAAALIIEARDSFLSQPTSPAQMRSLLQGSAVDMHTPGFDFISGYGLINIDLTLRTFAAPRPFIDTILIPSGNLPGEVVDTIILLGDNFSTHSVVYYNDSALASTVILDTINGIAKAVIPAFDDNPGIKICTPPISVNQNDGGCSNIYHFFTAEIKVIADSKTIKYSQAVPELTATVLINGIPLEDTTVTLADLGLQDIQLTTSAPANGNVGTYIIIPTASLDPEDPADALLLAKYNYQFINGTLTVQKMPLKVIPNDITAVDGQPLGNVTFTYQFDHTNVPNPQAIIDDLTAAHEAFLPNNALAVVKDFNKQQANGSALDTSDLHNMNTVASFNAVNNGRKLQVDPASGELVPATDLNTFNLYYYVDVASESIYEYLIDPSHAKFYGVYPGINKKALLGGDALNNHTAQVEVNSAFEPIVNGTLALTLPTENGPKVPVINDELVQIVNGQLLQFVDGHLEPIANEELVQIVNDELVQIVNGQLEPLANNELVQIANNALLMMVNDELVQIVNGIKVQEVGGVIVPVPNSPLVLLVNNELLQLVNGQLEPLANNQLVQLANDELVQIVNDELVQIVNGVRVEEINGELVPVPNEELVQIVNFELVQIVNGQLEPIANDELVQLVNGELLQMANDELVQIVNGEYELFTDYVNLNIINGETLQLVNDELVQIVNNDTKAIPNLSVIQFPNELVQIVNNGLEPIANDELVQIVNSGLEPIANDELLQIVNSNTTGAGNTGNNTGVIIDEADVNDLQNNWLGAMFGINMVTGLGVGENYLVPGKLVNPNFDITYGLGKVTITPGPCLLTHSPFKNFGNTTLNPTSLWLNIVTKVSGQLSSPGDYLLFKGGTVTFNFIAATPLVNNLPVPDGKIMAVAPIAGVTYPRTYFEFASNTWITEVNPGFASTSDIFVTGVLINSSNGFVKLNGNTNSVVKGKFYSNKYFSDQWAYAIAAYQLPQTPPSPPYEYVTYEMIGDPGAIVSINGTYRAATPVPILQYLVQGASGGGGNNYTGSKGSFDNFTACCLNCSPATITNSALVQQEVQANPFKGEFTIVPNPASDQITLSFVPGRSGKSKIILYTIEGRKVYEMEYGVWDAGNKYTKQIDVSSFKPGVYMIQLWSAGKLTVKKIIISR